MCLASACRVSKIFSGSKTVLTISLALLLCLFALKVEQLGPLYTSSYGALGPRGYIPVGELHVHVGFRKMLS